MSRRAMELEQVYSKEEAAAAALSLRSEKLAKRVTDRKLELECAHRGGGAHQKSSSTYGRPSACTRSRAKSLPGKSVAAWPSLRSPTVRRQ